MKIKNTKILKGDIIIILFVIFLALVIFLFMLPKQCSNRFLEIYLDGEFINSFELNESTYELIEVDKVVHNTIEIDGNKVRIINSTCYDHVCENTGYISQVGEVIVCMPNKLLLKIVGDKNKNDFDVVMG